MQTPMGKAEFAVYTQEPDEKDLDYIAYQTAKDARIYFEDPGGWPTFEAFLGYQIGKATARFAGFPHGREFIERFRLLVYSHAY